MPSWFTIVRNLPVDNDEHAVTFMESLARFAETAGIPENATWRAFRRGIGVVITAEWKYGAPGAVPATEVDLIGGVPVLVDAPEGAEEA